MKFTDQMYSKVGLGRAIERTGGARNAPANGAESFTNTYRLPNQDKGSMRELRELAGLTESDLVFPNPSGAIQLSPVLGENLFSERGKLDQTKRMKRLPRLFEDRQQEEIALQSEYKKQLRALTQAVDRAESPEAFRTALRNLHKKVMRMNMMLGERSSTQRSAGRGASFDKEGK